MQDESDAAAGGGDERTGRQQSGDSAGTEPENNPESDIEPPAGSERHRPVGEESSAEDGPSGATPGTDTGSTVEETQTDTAGEVEADAHTEGTDTSAAAQDSEKPDADSHPGVPENVPEDVRKYDKFKKIDGGTYDRANEFLRDRTYITAREWAIARLCADFRTETGIEMTKIGENLPRLVPFMTDTYSPQAVNQARASFEEKVRKSGATFLYGAMCDFFTAEELDDVMYEATEVAKFLLEVEGVDLAVEEELEAEDRISEVMREVREHSVALRHDEVTCPECDHTFDADG